MILNTLHLENYKQYRWLDLEFREGLVGIIGRNGAGKSTLFEAILFCLFGQERDKDLVRSVFAEPKATVLLTLSFTMGLERFLVKREFRGKILTAGAELYKNDELVAKGVSPVNEEVVRLLNMERDAFRRSVFSGQKELAELSEASGGDRQRMVRKMLGLDNLDEIKKRVNDDIRALRQQISGQAQLLLSADEIGALEMEIVEKEVLEKEAVIQLTAEKEKLAEVAGRQRQAHEAFAVQERLFRQFSELRRELDRGQERQANLARQATELNQRLAQLHATQAELDQRRSEFGHHESEKKALALMEEARQRKINFDANSGHLQDLQDQLGALKERLDQPEKEVAKRPKILETLANQKNALADVVARIEAQLERYRRADRDISALRERIRERQEKMLNLQAIGKDGACPTCFQPVRDAYEAVLAQLGDEISSLQNGQILHLEQEKEAAKKAGAELRLHETAVREQLERLNAEDVRLVQIGRQLKHEHDQRQKLEAQIIRYQQVLLQIGEVHFEEAHYLDLKKRVESREQAFLDFLKTDAYIARELPAVQSALVKNSEETAQEAATMEIKTAALATIGHDPSAYESARSQLAGFEEAYAAQSAAVNSLERIVQDAHNEIARRREKIKANARIQSLIGDKQSETELLDKLALSLDGFRNEILEKVSPSISREASALFSRITKGKYESILVDENFDFRIADGGEYYPIRRFSGGEIDLANFCLRIAITKAIMELSGSGQGIEFLAFDEIFGSQDEERRLEILLALNFLQEQFRQIYIVSHIESLRDYFPNILEVKSLQEGGSTATWV